MFLKSINNVSKFVRNQLKQNKIKSIKFYGIMAKTFSLGCIGTSLNIHLPRCTTIISINNVQFLHIKATNLLNSYRQKAEQAIDVSFGKILVSILCLNRAIEHRVTSFATRFSI